MIKEAQKSKKLIAVFIINLITYIVPNNVLAQSRIDNPAIATSARSGTGPQALQRFISSFVGIMTVVGAFIFLYIFITGAIQFITSEGDKNAYETARKKITMGVVGLVVLIAAIFVSEVVAGFLGVPDIFNLPDMVTRISEGLSP